MSDNVEVGRGLNRIFIGQLLVIVAMIFGLFPNCRTVLRLWRRWFCP